GGNGAFLIHAYNVISLQTLRGAHLEDHPLILVGADFNQSALKVTRRNIIKSEIWAKLVWGDIGDPQSLAQDLKDNFNILLEDLLNVRTFFDHNRIWKDIPKAKRIKTSTSQGAFAYKGMRINNNALEENLRQHLELWKPYINKFGLLAIELHTISPSLISENLGKTPATAYNATHGYSDQYILELKIFRTLAESVGLQLNQDASCRFPESDLATVSINYFEGKI
ncbi:MAG: class I SAM-dependent methyltransferase, partial [Saprospiraceae bacterium]